MASNTKGIFISYRREEAAAYAGWMGETLGEHFGKHRVFRDIDSIEPGLDFVESIQRAVGSAEVVLTLIGKSWLTAADDAAGRPRLHNPDDYVRMEIATALKQRDVRVLPVLIQGAPMPRVDELPDDLATLALRNAFEMRDTRWRDDMQRLIITLENVLGSREEPEAEPELPSWTPKWGQIGVAVLLAGAVPMLLNTWLKALLVDSGFLRYLPIELFDFVEYIYLSLAFLFRLIALPCGFWVGLVWPGKHLKGYTLLGLAAGFIGLFVDWVLTRSFDFMSNPLGILDYLLALTTTILFISGVLFAGLWRKHKRKKHKSY